MVLYLHYSTTPLRNEGRGGDKTLEAPVWKLGLDRETCCLWWASLAVLNMFKTARGWPKLTFNAPSSFIYDLHGFKANWRPSWNDHLNDLKLGVCKQIILRGFRNRFRMQPMFHATTLNVHVNITKLFCELPSMLLLLPTAAILEISVASQKRRGKLYHLISIQSTYFARQL